MVARAFDGVLGVDEGQQAARRIARFDVRVNVLDEVVLVFLGVVRARFIVAALHAIERFAVLGVRFASDGITDAGRGHEVADVGGVDEDLCHVDFAREGAEGGDASPCFVTPPGCGRVVRPSRLQARFP